jgi:protein-L-isoaspartate(D-aspartate) O-methyltransferase
MAERGPDRPVNDFPWANRWPEITNGRLRQVFARVPRAAFVPPQMQPYVDQDAPLPIGEGQTISQPFIVAWMTQALNLQPGERTLEIGTGSGYQTAILCEMTAQADEPPGRWVYSVERYGSLAQRAKTILDELGYQPHLRIGDGALGWPEVAPYPAIIVTAAPAHLPRPLWEQLAEGGRMVIPIGGEPEHQSLWLITKRQGQLQTRNLGDVRFVPLLSPILENPAMWVQLPLTRP